MIHIIPANASSERFRRIRMERPMVMMPVEEHVGQCRLSLSSKQINSNAESTVTPWQETEGDIVEEAAI